MCPHGLGEVPRYLELRRSGLLELQEVVPAVVETERRRAVDAPALTVFCQDLRILFSR